MTHETNSPLRLGDVHHRSVILHGVLEAIAKIQNDGDCSNGLTALIDIAVDLSDQLSSELDSAMAPGRVQ